MKTVKQVVEEGENGNPSSLYTEALNGINNMDNGNPSFNCIRCGELYTPAKDQWIFYDLCRNCFWRFDYQKNERRYLNRARFDKWFAGNKTLYPNKKDYYKAQEDFSKTKLFLPYFESGEKWTKACPVTDVEKLIHKASSALLALLDLKWEEMSVPETGNYRGTKQYQEYEEYAKPFDEARDYLGEIEQKDILDQLDKT